MRTEPSGCFVPCLHQTHPAVRRLLLAQAGMVAEEGNVHANALGGLDNHLALRHLQLDAVYFNSDQFLLCHGCP
jgi:hypothetical protein